MTNNPFLIYYDLRKFTKIHFENGTNEDSHLKSAIVSDPLRDRVCFVFTNLSDEYEHQYVISFFELSYNERTLVPKYFYRWCIDRCQSPITNVDFIE